MGKRCKPFRGIIVACFFCSLAAAFAGCSTISGPGVVNKGDRVWVDYTCRLENGLVAMTTYEDIAENISSRSGIFVPFSEYGSESITAGDEDQGQSFGKLKMFESEVSYRIAQAVVGMRVGKNYTVTLKSEAPPNLEPAERYMNLPRIRPRKKNQRLSHEYIKNKLGHEPVLGEKVFAYDGIKGTVKAMDDKFVTVYVEVKDGISADTPFGTIVVRDRDEQYYDCVIDAQVGHLVRTDTQIGRIIEVTNDRFTVDYGHPFGGEDLICDIVVEAKQGTKGRQ